MVIKPQDKGIRATTKEKKSKPKEGPNNVSPHDNQNILSSYRDAALSLILRLVPYSDLIDKVRDLNNAFNVFTFKNYFSNELENTVSNPQYFILKSLDLEHADKVLYVRLYFFEDFLSNFKLELFGKSLFVNEVVFNYFRCDVGARVQLEPYRGTISEVQEIEIFTKKNYSLDMRQTFQRYLADNCRTNDFVLNPGVILEINPKMRCYLKFQPANAKFCVVNTDFVRDCKFGFVDEVLPLKEIKVQSFIDNRKYQLEVANYQKIIDDYLFLVSHNNTMYGTMPNAIITGKFKYPEIYNLRCLILIFFFGADLQMV